MSLFDSLQNKIIEKPKQTGTYKKARKKNREREEKKTEKQIRMEMKEKLPEDEYKKWYMKREYEKRKKQYKAKYKEKRKQETKEMIELCNYLRPGNDTTNRDKYYTEKLGKDDIVSHSYKFSWWASKIVFLNWNHIPRQKKPFRISPRHSLDYSIRLLHDRQYELYEYLRPHIDEIKDCRLGLWKKQKPLRHPLWWASEPLNTLANNLGGNPDRLYTIADAIIRGKFMVSELYLGRTSFIIGDILAAQNGNSYRISLENNLPWLTKDTVEDVHKTRMDWWKHKGKTQPPIYMVNDAYLIKVSLKGSILYYIVPT